VLDEADPSPESFAVDLGCGSGQVTLALAKRCRKVLGVDVSEEMIALLLENAKQEGVSNVEGRAVGEIG
jgi:tRNA/tmRNA/rRNA uracil-C5-methylase (TrmA/RlmC/RlmD family)